LAVSTCCNNLNITQTINEYGVWLKQKPYSTTPETLSNPLNTNYQSYLANTAN
jgi:hypothetical protein